MPSRSTDPVASDDDTMTGDRWSWGDSAALAIALLVLVITTVAAIQGTSAIEADAFEALNGLPGWLEGPTWVVMQLGTVGLAAIVGVVTGYALRRPALALLFAVTPVVAWYAARVVKDLVERGRPAAEGLAVTIRGTPDDGYGFVSGHSAVAFALATVVAPYVPRPWRVVPFVLATVVALARPYVGAHLPLDVVGGAALGVAVGSAAHGVGVLVARSRAMPSA